MALYFNLPVYKDSYDMLLMVFKYCSKLPKEYKYTLGERLKNDCTDVLLSIFEATKNKEHQKLKNIENALNHLERCRLYIRLFKDLKVWGVTTQVALNQKIETISKQLTQWNLHTARVQP